MRSARGARSVLASVDIVDGVELLVVGMVPAADWAEVVEGVVAGAVDWGKLRRRWGPAERRARHLTQGCRRRLEGVSEPLPPELAVPDSARRQNRTW